MRHTWSHSFCSLTYFEACLSITSCCTSSVTRIINCSSKKEMAAEWINLRPRWTFCWKQIPMTFKEADLQLSLKEDSFWNHLGHFGCHIVLGWGLRFPKVDSYLAMECQAISLPATASSIPFLLGCFCFRTLGWVVSGWVASGWIVKSYLFLLRRSCISFEGPCLFKVEALVLVLIIQLSAIKIIFLNFTA